MSGQHCCSDVPLELWCAVRHTDVLTCCTDGLFACAQQLPIDTIMQSGEAEELLQSVSVAVIEILRAVNRHAYAGFGY
eukprot:16251-Heterococcus_DN1.PRE.2